MQLYQSGHRWPAQHFVVFEGWHKDKAAQSRFVRILRLQAWQCGQILAQPSVREGV
jgi:hypothetical protein